MCCFFFSCFFRSYIKKLCKNQSHTLSRRVDWLWCISQHFKQYRTHQHYCTLVCAPCLHLTINNMYSESNQRIYSAIFPLLIFQCASLWMFIRKKKYYIYIKVLHIKNNNNDNNNMSTSRKNAMAVSFASGIGGAHVSCICVVVDCMFSSFERSIWFSFLHLPYDHDNNYVHPLLLNV